MPSLTVSERKALKARAHGLDPVVIIGNGGLSAAVLAEIDRSLNSHDLIKIRASGEREEREAMLEKICETLDAAPVQHIGKVLVVYRPLKDAAEKKSARRRRGKPQTKKQLGNRS